MSNTTDEWLWTDIGYVFNPDYVAPAPVDHQALLRQTAECAEKTDAIYDRCKDLSKQGWSALSDARLFLNLATPFDIEEAKQNIDLAQSSFADTIIASERRAEAAEALLRQCGDALKKALLWTDEENDVGDWRTKARAALEALRKAGVSHD